MEVDQRSLMKGMLAGEALIVPEVLPCTFAASPVRRPNPCLKWLGGTAGREKFASGAFAACGSLAFEDLQVVRQNSGLIIGTDELVRLLEQSQGARWTVGIDDTSASIFRGIAPTANARFVSIGTHAGLQESAWPLRHGWTTTS